MTKYQSFKNGLCATIMAISPILLSAQLVKHDRLLSFESTEVPSFVAGIHSDLSISGQHYKDGTQSLQWKFQPGGSIIIHKDLKFEKKDPTGTDKYLSVFVVWIYNEKPIDKTLQFEFQKDGKTCSSFPFGLNFHGWRAAWVSYERDMKGTPEEGMNEIRITAPDVAGEIYIDHLLTAAKMDHRYQTADLQVPFVNKETGNHWLFALKYSRLTPDIPLEATVSNTQKQEIEIIEKRLREIICPPGEVTSQTIANLRKAYEHYGIVYKDGKVAGLPLFYGQAAEAYERILPNWKGNLMAANNMDVSSFFNLMNRIAVAYNNTTNPQDKAVLKQMFIAMYDHITDQGVAYGSCLGNITHYGYSFRTFFTAYFLMKEVFKEIGKQEEAEKAMLWYSTVNDVYNKPQTAGIDIDFFNTLSTGRIASILFMEDTPEKQKRFLSEINYMKAHWSEILTKGDPYYNENFSLNTCNYTLRKR